MEVLGHKQTMISLYLNQQPKGENKDSFTHIALQKLESHMGLNIS
jgi:hypothetical protein